MKNDNKKYFGDWINNLDLLKKNIIMRYLLNILKINIYIYEYNL